MAKNSIPGVLILEDEALIAREISSRLTQMGYRVVGVAHNAAQAIQKAADSRPDLLLADIHLGDDIDGIQAAERITADHDIPVVFLTAYSDPETVSRAKEIAPFGYIIKPFENRELQITIEIALYKAQLERELKETKALLSTALQCIGDSLVFIDSAGCVSNLNPEAEQLFGCEKADVAGMAWPDFLQLDKDQAAFSVDFIERALNASSVTTLSPFLGFRRDGAQLLLEGVVGPLEDGKSAVLILRKLAELHEPVESLPSPDELETKSASGEASFVLLLIAASGLAAVMTEQGQGAADKVVKEITKVLNDSLRATDLASQYTGTVFSVSLPYTSTDEGKKIAGVILRDLTRHRFLGGKFSKEFCIGLAHSDPGDQEPLELFRRANWALRVARETGPGKIVSWRPEVEAKLLGDPVRQSTQSRNETGRDYRNMVLLWNVMSVVGKTSDARALAARVVSHIHRSFGLRQTALFVRGQGRDNFLCGSREQTEVTTDIKKMQFQSDHVDRISTLLTDNQIGELHVLEGTDETVRLFPLGKGPCGALLYVSEDQQKVLSAKDVSFLETLVDYLSTPISELTAQMTPKRAPVQRDDSVNPLLYQSPKMEALMEHINLVAPTEATVLISGESGTGKELVAKTIHDLSPRADKPFVIVDCTAVVESLIESELFGYKQGAFTGAQRSKHGRLREAAGGTIFLDEIGELPTDIQAKFLRFVQERQFVPVGSSVYETVDTRIIAATNKNLEDMVQAGRFREDLFFRLNVFSIKMPSLRERDDDIMSLADHFLRQYSAQYGKHIVGFTLDAEQAMRQYDWPGNVRELINMMIRGVIMCQGQRLSAIHLGIFPDGEAASASTPSPVAERADDNDIERKIEKEFRAFIDLCLRDKQLWPIGSWLEEDMILASLSANDQVAVRAAEQLSIPESTIRRKLNIIKHRYDGQAPQRPTSWLRVQMLLLQLAPVAKAQGLPSIDFANQLLIESINRSNVSRQNGAILAGVSIPTLRKKLGET